jgi:hypothetical protein
MYPACHLQHLAVWRWFLFFAILVPLYYLPNYLMLLMVAMVESKLLNAGPHLIYYIMGVRYVCQCPGPGARHRSNTSTCLRPGSCIKARFVEDECGRCGSVAVRGSGQLTVCCLQFLAVE